MTVKAKIIAQIIETEGGYVNDPHDSGGETKYGITKAVARQYGYTGAMKSLPKSLAEKIYGQLYWDGLKLDDVEVLSPALAYEIADSGINLGPYQVALWLQECLNIFNRQGDLYPDLLSDGVVGRKTLVALKSYFSARPNDGEAVLLSALNCLQGAKYLTLACAREKDESFVFGWIKNRVFIPQT